MKVKKAPSEWSLGVLTGAGMVGGARHEDVVPVDDVWSCVYARNKSDLAVWDLAGIAIVVKSRHFAERRDFPPLWGSPRLCTNVLC